MHVDCRIFNTDRNDANILVRRRHIRNEDGAIEGVKLELVPIDHGYAIPDSLEVSWAILLPPRRASYAFGWEDRMVRLVLVQLATTQGAAEQGNHEIYPAAEHR